MGGWVGGMVALQLGLFVGMDHLRSVWRGTAAHYGTESGWVGLVVVMGTAVRYSTSSRIRCCCCGGVGGLVCSILDFNGQRQ